MPPEHPTTLPEKLWNRHLVHRADGEPDLLYIDLHLVHEVTSPQAFDGLRLAGRGVRRPDLTIATEDHNVPTADIDQPIADEISAKQVDTLRRNAAEFGVTNYPMGDPDQGIVHVVGPEMGITHPGMTIVCGDSHTSTHGAFGALAFGIGSTEVGYVLATQCLLQRKPRNMRVTVDGELPPDVSAKDLALHIINRIGVNGGTGHVIEYAGSAIRALDMESRMTLCNLSIEAGARAGMIAPDEVTVEYLRSRPRLPEGEAFDKLATAWLELASDPGARFDCEIELDAGELAPAITYGTDPGMSIAIDGEVPVAESVTAERALKYMAVEAGKPLLGRAVDVVFVGSCTNGRISDLRRAAEVLRDRRVAENVRMLVVPGSEAVRRQAEAEGLDQVFRQAGAEWREPGCSMCIAMNGDIAAPGKTVVTTSNRNFEGRQGAGSRSMLASPATAAACAVAGRVTDPREFTNHREVA